MNCGTFYEETGQPLTGRKLARLKDFLAQSGLCYDAGAEYTVNLVTEDGEIAATGSLERNVLKCIAVAGRFQGEGLTAKVVTHLMTQAALAGHAHLFLFTKPGNGRLFAGLGFSPITETADVLLMENRPDGIGRYVRSLSRGSGEAADPSGIIGAVVANCNPFTLGHRYLIEAAAAQCDILHLFILSEDRSLFPANVRFRLAEEGIRGIGHVILHPTSDYLISSAVFPTYFMKDKARADEANCELDIRIFGEHFARALGINRRFAGTEPFCSVTAAYNRAMARILPEYGVELVEIPRMAKNGRAVSASLVRELMAAGELEAIRPLVPPATWAYITSPEGQRLAEKLHARQDAP